MNPFVWIRKRVAESVIAGVADGLAAVTPEGDEQQAPDLDSLRMKLAAAITAPAALPAAGEEPRGGAKGKAGAR